MHGIMVDVCVVMSINMSLSIIVKLHWGSAEGKVLWHCF
jgi:hypothetical protein